MAIHTYGQMEKLFHRNIYFKLTWNSGDEPERSEDPEGSEGLHVEPLDLEHGQDGAANSTNKM